MRYLLIGSALLAVAGNAAAIGHQSTDSTKFSVAMSKTIKEMNKLYECLQAHADYNLEYIAANGAAPSAATDDGYKNLAHVTSSCDGINLMMHGAAAGADAGVIMGVIDDPDNKLANQVSGLVVVPTSLVADNGVAWSWDIGVNTDHSTKFATSAPVFYLNPINEYGTKVTEVAQGHTGSTVDLTSWTAWSSGKNIFDCSEGSGAGTDKICRGYTVRTLSGNCNAAGDYSPGGGYVQSPDLVNYLNQDNTRTTTSYATDSSDPSSATTVAAYSLQGLRPSYATPIVQIPVGGADCQDHS